MNIIQIIILVIRIIHIVGWIVINGILYLFAQYPPTSGELLASFFLWEVGIIIIVWEMYNEKAKNALSNFGSKIRRS